MVPHGAQDLSVVLRAKDVLHTAVFILDNHGLDDSFHFGTPADIELAAHALEELGSGAGNIARGEARTELLPRGTASNAASEEAAVDHDERSYAVRVQGGRVQRDVGAPGVADHGCCLKTQVVKQTHGVGCERGPIVAVAGLR